MGENARKTLDFYERVCPCCDKVFYVTSASMWAYKIVRRETSKAGKARAKVQVCDYYCSYSCHKQGKALQDQAKDESKRTGEKHWTKRGKQHERTPNTKRKT